jgi:hypothetical protein
MYITLQKTTSNGLSSYFFNNKRIQEPDYFTRLDQFFYEPLFYFYQLGDGSPGNGSSLKKQEEKQQHYNPNTIIQHLKNILEKTTEEEEKILQQEEQEIYQKCVEKAKEKQKSIIVSVKCKPDILQKNLEKVGFSVKQLEDNRLEVSGW